MKVLRFILEKEFRQIFRDKTILAMMLVMPTIQLIILPLAMNFDVKNVNLVVVDQDHSSYSSQLVNKIGASGYFKLVSYNDSYRDALHYIQTGEADLILEIPPSFEKNLVRETQQELSISADGINSMKASLGTSYVNAVLKDYQNALTLNLSTVRPAPGTSTIELTWSNWFNPRAEYKYYIVPGILVLLLTMIGGFLSALNIVREKEAGTIEQINVSPIKKWQFILGKMIPFWVVGMVVFTIGLLVALIVYGIVPVGNLAVLYLFASLYMVALLGFGFLISTYSDNQLQAMFVAFFFMMIFMLMSGLFTSVESMPAWARTIANLTPVTHFVKVVRMIVLKGSGFNEIGIEFLYQGIFAVVLNGWAILNYRKTA